MNMVKAVWTGLILTDVNAQKVSLVRGVKPTLMSAPLIPVRTVAPVWTGLIPTRVSAPVVIEGACVTSVSIDRVISVRNNREYLLFYINSRIVVV